MANAEHPLSDEVILARTDRGLHEMWIGNADLDPSQRRLLHFVNGITPLNALLERLQPAEDLKNRMHRLVQLGLVEPVGISAPENFAPL
jgi:hypothetical protein